MALRVATLILPFFKAAFPAHILPLVQSRSISFNLVRPALSIQSRFSPCFSLNDLNALNIEEDGAIVYDSDTVEVDPKELGTTILGREDLTMLPVPLKTIAGEHGKADLMRNTVALGVAIALGTDAGSWGVDHGVAVRRELSLLAEAGIPLAAAVRCSTLNVARLLGLAQQGALVPGWSADLLVVNGSPQHLADQLKAPLGICRRGQWLDGYF